MIDALAGLRAKSRIAEDDLDLLGTFGADGWFLTGPWGTLAAGGCAAVLELPAGRAARRGIAAALAEIAHDDPTGIGGAGIVALGALPFDPLSPAVLVVPSVVVRRTPSGHTTITAIGPGDPDPVLPPLPPITGVLAPAVLGETMTPSPRGYEDAVAAATKAIAAGELAKVVLAREVTLTLESPLDVVAALRRLSAREPLCTTYSVPTDEGRFFGASPELLLERHGSAVRSHPLAGTVALDGSAEDARRERFLEASAKNRDEHLLVVEDIVEALAEEGVEVSAAPRPSLVELRSIAHLGTEITGTVTDPEADVLDLLAAIVPTPAVGGVPRAAALTLLGELEPFDRRSWAGAIGWVDAHGDGRFMLGIRGAHQRGAALVLHAGCGIVAESDPADELEETAVKLRAVLDVVLPNRSA